MFLVPKVFLVVLFLGPSANADSIMLNRASRACFSAASAAMAVCMRAVLMLVRPLSGTSLRSVAGTERELLVRADRSLSVAKRPSSSAAKEYEHERGAVRGVDVLVGLSRF